MRTLVCFVEGPSDAALLACLLPKLLPADMAVQSPERRFGCHPTREPEVRRNRPDTAGLCRPDAVILAASRALNDFAEALGEPLYGRAIRRLKSREKQAPSAQDQNNNL